MNELYCCPVNDVHEICAVELIRACWRFKRKRIERKKNSWIARRNVHRNFTRGLHRTCNFAASCELRRVKAARGLDYAARKGQLRFSVWLQSRSLSARAGKQIAVCAAGSYEHVAKLNFCALNSFGIIISRHRYLSLSPPSRMLLLRGCTCVCVA